MDRKLQLLSADLTGDLYFDSLLKSLYATDASVYREIPLAVCYPKTLRDLKLLIEFATLNKTSLIPRAAGTSLAGQCTGDGIVVDISKHFTRIIDIDTVQKTVRVQPGVIRDDLNRELLKYNLFFGPNTSTSNRCMLGGMVGNNSSGTTSIQYGTTRDKLISLQTLLSDGTEVEWKALNKVDYQQKLELQNLEGTIYREIDSLLGKKEYRESILKEYPPKNVHRRNTGYAIDELINSNLFNLTSSDDFNVCKLLAGSEGTLAFTTEITLQLDDLPPKFSGMIAAHFSTINACMRSVEPVMKHELYTCEMMDRVILDCTQQNLKYRENRFFIEGDPKAILMLEVRAHSEEHLHIQLNQLEETLKQSKYSYANPILLGNQIEQALELRKAGLGLLGNMTGDKKAVACIEDTAVALPVLADYIAEFEKIMEKYGQQAVYYAHAGAGELHLRPILNLKEEADVKLFRSITEDVVKLVKSYNGSLSGEHGDGRLRAEFLEEMIGASNYQILKQIKNVFDSQNIFNPGKIVEAKKMDKNLRYIPGRIEPQISTIMDFSDSLGILRMAEKCNGSGDCRKSVEAGGTMCPSYRATRDEKDTTRARANALREFLTSSTLNNPFNHPELKEVMDLCISCKGCKSECPSNVDVAALKSEFQYQYLKSNKPSFQDKIFANITNYNAKASKLSGVFNFLVSNTFTASILKKVLGVHRQRSIPRISSKSLEVYYHENKERLSVSNPIKTVYLFNDEFTRYLDTQIGIDALELLSALKYQVQMVPHEESGRSAISKGFLKKAKSLANHNVNIFKELITEEIPLIGIEPSAILSFRDEYLRLAEDKAGAEKLSKNSFLIEEFLKQEISLGNITAKQFTKNTETLKIHPHCHQKALSNSATTFDILNLPENYKVTIINAGCCGMAGSFGYEKQHYNISMKIGEQSLFPAIHKASKNTIIAANGTSCRHQIIDGTGRVALHPLSILKNALK